MHFDSVEYLRHGNPRQRAAHNALTAQRVMDKLRDHRPILTGTLPIGVDIEDSDLDIICQYDDKVLFKKKLVGWFGDQPDFTMRDLPDRAAVVADFRVDSFIVEIFGQHTPVKEQMAYKHLLTEYHLLQVYGDVLRNRVIELKQQGYKTEPAFALALGLEGDPYTVLLTYRPPERPNSDIDMSAVNR